MRLILNSILFLLIPLVGISQITGKIVDENSGKSLEYATAALFETNSEELVLGVVTNVDGSFILNDIEKGNYYLEASFIGFQKVTVKNIEITILSKQIDVGMIQLDLSENQLNEVLVEGERAIVSTKIDRQVYDATSFQNAQGGSATDVLKNIPSITVNGLGELSLRGSTGFVVLLNGSPLQGDAATLINQLPANAVDRIEVITAPSAKYDPEGKGGILNIITVKGNLNGSFAQVNIKAGLPSIENYGNADAHQRYGIDATYNILKDAWNLSFGANYQRNDIGGRREGDVYTILEDTLTRFPSTGERSFDEENYSGRLTIDYHPDTLKTYSLGFFAGKRQKDRLADIIYFDNHAITPVGSDNRVYTFQYYNHNLRKRSSDFALGSFDYSQTFMNGSRVSASFLYEYTQLGGPTESDNLGYPDASIIYQKEYNTNDNPLKGIRLQMDYLWKPLSIGVLETGFQYRNLDHQGDFVYQRINNESGIFELVPEFSSEVDLVRKIYSGYTQISGKLNRWEYAGGLRMEAVNRDFDLRDKQGIIDTTYKYNYVKAFPSASVQYTFENDVRFKLAYSKRVERTTTFKMNPFPEREHSETLEQGDPTLKPEFIDLFELGISKNFRKGNSLFATAYFRDLKNLVNRVNTIYNDTILNRIYSNVGNSNSLGLELGLQLKPTKNWSNFIGTNLYNYTIDGFYDGNRINSKAFIYSINANSSYEFQNDLTAQFTLNYISDVITAQGRDSQFYSPNLSLRKLFLDGKLAANLQWQNIDMGLLKSNEQSITAYREDAFFTTTKYIYEVDIIMLNLSYTFNRNKNKSNFIESEFGEREF